MQTITHRDALVCNFDLLEAVRARVPVPELNVVEGDDEVGRDVIFPAGT